ncbi:MAG: hypothetical protein R2865_00600 [Deinococcales bacterium]
MRFLKKNTGTVFKLISGYRPDELLQDLAEVYENGVETLHIYTFNHVEKTEAWRQSF